MPQFYIIMISLGWLVNLHPFFLSLTEIRQNPESKKLEIAQKIFWDDLEVAMENYTDKSVDFLNPEDKAAFDQQLKNYLLEQNKIWVDGKEVQLNFLGYEVEDDAAWFYLESAPVSWRQDIQVRNTLLLQDFDTQQNIIHIYKNTKSPRSLLLRKGEEMGKVKVD